MMQRFCTALGLAAVLLAGCHRGGPYMDAYLDMLDAEKRSLEDQVYSYQAKYEKAESELEACRKELDRLRAGTKIPAAEPGVVPPADSEPDGTAPPFDLNPPTVEPGTPAPAPPVIDPGTPPARKSRKPPTTEPGTAVPAAPASALPAPHTEPEELPASELRADGSAPLHHIVLSHRLTRGKDFDGQAGDDGLAVAIQPRAADERALAQFGRVSVVLLDPRLVGQEARFARWDFSADEVRAALEQAGGAKEIRLQMKWPAGPPQHNRLHLFVRLETEQGRRFQADREIYVNLSTSEYAGWTPRHDAAEEDVSVATRPDHPPATVPADGVVAGHSAALPGESQPSLPTWSPTRPATR